MAETSIKEQLRRIEADNRQLRTDFSGLQRRVQHLKEGRMEVCKIQNHLSRMMRWSNTFLHADMAGEMVRALQEHSRKYALGHVGIGSIMTGPDCKPGGDQILHLVKNWAATYRTVLSTAQTKGIKRKFGIPFIHFLNTDINTAKANIPAHTHRCDMPWAERAFLMDALDALQPKQVRAGGRRAYLSLFGGKDWAEVKETVKNELAATCSL